MPRRKREMTPSPLATPEQATRFGIEKVRTAAGTRLFDESRDWAALARRLEVKIDAVRYRVEDDTATGIVWTRLDGGAWVNEGGFLLSRKMPGAGKEERCP